MSSMLSLSADERTLTFLPKRARQSPPYDPARFDCWPNALGTLAISSGTHSWVLDVGQSAAYKVSPFRMFLPSSFVSPTYSTVVNKKKKNVLKKKRSIVIFLFTHMSPDPRGIWGNFRNFSYNMLKCPFVSIFLQM